jgi:hypothetical protein
VFSEDKRGFDEHIWLGEHLIFVQDLSIVQFDDAPF